MRIIIDAMSGDNAPLEMLKGAVLAAEEGQAEIVVVGDEKIIKEVSEKENLDIGKISVVHADSVINMEDEALAVIRSKKDSSMSVGLKMEAPHLLRNSSGSRCRFRSEPGCWRSLRS